MENFRNANRRKRNRFWSILLAIAFLFVLYGIKTAVPEQKEAIYRWHGDKEITHLPQGMQLGTYWQPFESPVTIVIDPGHGGRDGGKEGVTGVLEKDINLQISDLLREELEAAGYEVVMTRQEDKGLYDENAESRKLQDLQRRIDRIEEEMPHLVISIHQNSFPDANVRGPQVFYYQGSDEGAQLAASIQAAIERHLPTLKKREIKEDNTYYLLKHSPCTMVIVECGFLSNYEDCLLLEDREFQKKMAEAIRSGIVDFYQKNQYN